VRGVTDRPVCIGIGVSTPEQAVQACAEADGVVVGSAIVRRLLDGEGPEGVGRFVASLRAGIDGAVA
jgi:tryptophan synthase alpha chain